MQDFWCVCVSVCMDVCGSLFFHPRFTAAVFNAVVVGCFLISFRFMNSQFDSFSRLVHACKILQLCAALCSKNNNNGHFVKLFFVRCPSEGQQEKSTNMHGTLSCG